MPKGPTPMTALNIIRQGEIVHIISDGVFCDSNGIVCELAPNTWSLPHLPAAIGISGSPHIMPFLVNRLGRECRSFDDIPNKIVPIALDVHISFPMTYGNFGWGDVRPEFDLVAAGWSEARRRPVSYLVTRSNRSTGSPHSGGFWEVIELPDALIAPPVSKQTFALAGWNLPDSPQTFRPESDGIRLLETQRLSPVPINPKEPDGNHGFVVGGFVLLTSISANGVSERVLHRWPDRIGRKIVPIRPAQIEFVPA
jgi:hypothetical protein